MDPATVWTQFRDKIAQGTLQDSDCQLHAGVSYARVLSHPMWANMRNIIAAQRLPPFEHGEEKTSFTISIGPAEQLRLDFIVREDGWQFCLLDGTTIPIKSIPQLPFSDFPPLPETEDLLRMERLVSEKVYLYCRLKQELGPAKALEWFRDGQGYRLNVEAWLPYFRVRKAFVVASAWMERRYWGQRMTIVELSQERAILEFCDHLYFRVYETVGHLKPQLPLEDYRHLFEDLWKDQCSQVGWSVQFDYQGNDTQMIMLAVRGASA